MAQPALKKEAPPVHTPGRGRIYDSITDTIGDTPIVRLDRIAKEHNIRANLLGHLRRHAHPLRLSTKNLHRKRPLVFVEAHLPFRLRIVSRQTLD